MTNSVKAYGTHTASDPLATMAIDRRTVEDNDVEIDILYCGVCHTDIHQARNEWGFTTYPIVPGHEIIGRVLSLGKRVKDFKVGDLVGVGCLVDSCRQCHHCQDDLEQYCESGIVATYNSADPKRGGITYGGYSQKIVVDKNYVLRVPENLDTKAVAPILCAGITMWSPLRHWQVASGDTVGIVGLGGLGHMGIKLAHALGAKTVMITRSKSKGDDAKLLGADEVILSNDEAAMAHWSGKFDLIIDTVPCNHDINPYVTLLKTDATLVIVGAIEPVEPGLNCMPLVFGRKRIAGSLIGGIAETQELLDFCGKHNIVANVEMIDMEAINQCYERMLQSDIKYRFVIDMKTLR